VGKGSWTDWGCGGFGNGGSGGGVGATGFPAQDICGSNVVRVDILGAKKMAFLMVVVVSLWSVWPAMIKPNRISDYGSDGWFINWAIGRQGKIVSDIVRDPKTGVGAVFGGNIFYPYKNTLAYSEMFTLSGILSTPVSLLSNSPGPASGVVMVVGQVATMALLYLWFGKGWGGVIGTIAFGLSQIRWEYQVHLQMWSHQYWLVGTWLLSSSLRERKFWKLMAGAILVGLQAWESVLPVYFAAIVLSAQCLVLREKISIKHLVLAGIIVGVVAWPVVKVYSGVAREFNYQRSIRDAAAGSIGIDDLWGKFWSPGLYVLLVVAVLSTKGRVLRMKETRWWVVVMIIGLVMALGPALKWQGKTVKIGGKYPIPLPYAAAYYSVPGFGALRTPSRWMWLAGWGASGLIAIGLTNTSRRGIFSVGVIGVLLVAVVGGTHLTKYIELPKPEDFPAVYKWLVSQPGDVIVELPVGGDERESKRMYYSLVHGKNLVNGFSGFAPPVSDWRNVGVNYVIVHKDECPKLNDQCSMKGKIAYEDEATVVVRP